MWSNKVNRMTRKLKTIITRGEMQCNSIDINWEYILKYFHVCKYIQPSLVVLNLYHKQNSINDVLLFLHYIKTIINWITILHSVYIKINHFKEKWLLINVICKLHDSLVSHTKFTYVWFFFNSVKWYHRIFLRKKNLKRWYWIRFRI